jgi:hypothetical protein
MSKSYDDPEQYNGWTNRETWAVALHINNDQGWQEQVHEAIRPKLSASFGTEHAEYHAGLAIRENVEQMLDITDCGDDFSWAASVLTVMTDIGSLWRVNWTELGSSFLSDLEEVDSDS